MIDWGFIFEQSLAQAVDFNAIAFVLAAMGLNVHFGYAGLLNFGQIGFVAMGAYGFGLTVTLWGIESVFVAVVIGLLFTVAFSLILGIPTLRLRADYLAIVTLGFSETVRLVVTSEKRLTNGVQGIPGIPRLFEGLGVGLPSGLATLGLLLAANVLAVLVFVRLSVGPFGRVLQVRGKLTNSPPTLAPTSPHLLASGPTTLR